MSKKILCVVVGLACALALTAGTARAHDGRQPTIVFSVQNLGDASAACPGSLFGLSFDIVSPGRSLLGSGVSCVQSLEGCQFAAGCHDTVGATFTLDLPGRGSLTAPVVLRETWLTDTTVLQLDHGTITSATGDFAGAGGSINCVGTVQFTDTEVIPRLVCVVGVN
jgi:hypothetical protein